MSLALDVSRVEQVLLMDGWHRVAHASFELDGYEFIHDGQLCSRANPRSSRPWVGGGRSPTARRWRVPSPRSWQ
jgi:hypothetical protein